MGLLVGGVFTAAAACVLGAALLRPWMPDALLNALVALVAVLALARQAGLPIPLPQNARQVPEYIEGRGPRAGPLQFGVEMGTGLRTFMTSPVPHLALVAVVAWADLPAALIAGASFGAGRALMSLSRHASHDRAAWDARLAAREGVVKVAMLIAALVSIVTIYLTNH
ncbi:hypothetical protein [Serinicoccus kebangsaanensis]|uniref:hypothetical protein n=1 Tax=Serinicoccus kebangsaanensis TaxID=2602069 RepID=UPI00192DC30C|nr:hypothetical protein [Serinicoccus kebangsaanensis]